MKYPKNLNDRQELMYRYELKYGDNRFMNLLARVFGLKTLYNFKIIRLR